ncbi:hypothetical protein V6Z11_D01G123900 [Gossypium hirsutum]
MFKCRLGIPPPPPILNFLFRFLPSSSPTFPFYIARINRRAFQSC